MANVVLVTPYFWPEVAASVPLVTSLAHDLAKAGHEVTVLTMWPSKDREKVRSETSNANVARELPTTVRIVRLRNPFARKPSVLAKLLEYAWFCLWAATRLAMLKSVQVCFVSSNPPLIASLLIPICRLRGIRLLYNLQDLFPDSAVAAGLLPARLERFFRPLERWTYKWTDLVVTISDGFADHVQRVAPGVRTAVVPNWVDTDSLHPIPHHKNRFRMLAHLDSKFVVLYAGNMGYLQDLEVITAAAELLLSVEDIVFVFVGEGPDRPKLESEVGRKGLSNCRFFGFQPHSLVPDLYSAGDIGLVSMRKGSGHSSIPSKTWSIMACGRPVVAACDLDSELASAIRDAQAGVVVQAGEPKLLAEAILDLYNHPEKQSQMGQAGRLYVEQRLSRTSVTARYDSLIQSLASYGRSLRESNGAPVPDK